MRECESEIGRNSNDWILTSIRVEMEVDSTLYAHTNIRHAFYPRNSAARSAFKIQEITNYMKNFLFFDQDDAKLCDFVVSLKAKKKIRWL